MNYISLWPNSNARSLPPPRLSSKLIFSLVKFWREREIRFERFRHSPERPKRGFRRTQFRLRGFENNNRTNNGITSTALIKKGIFARDSTRRTLRRQKLNRRKIYYKPTVLSRNSFIRAIRAHSRVYRNIFGGGEEGLFTLRSITVYI